MCIRDRSGQAQPVKSRPAPFIMRPCRKNSFFCRTVFSGVVCCVIILIYVICPDTEEADMPKGMFLMRSEKEMYDLILGFARADERVRGVILNLSLIHI